MKNKKNSKFLSLVLRHKPETIGLKLDENGWVNVNELITQMSKNGKEISFEELKDIVSTNDKQRFTFNEDGTLIRANQGHSIDVDVELDESIPPHILYHGTIEYSLKYIMEQGINKMTRNFVHLSEDIAVARNVGSRRGKAVVLNINTKQMIEDGVVFYKSKNGVWLTNFVDKQYITKN